MSTIARRWKWIALGLLIIIIVVYFQQGLLGWLMEKKPEWFGIVVDRKDAPATSRATATSGAAQ